MGTSSGIVVLVMREAERLWSDLELQFLGDSSTRAHLCVFLLENMISCRYLQHLTDIALTLNHVRSPTSWLHGRHTTTVSWWEQASRRVLGQNS